MSTSQNVSETGLCPTFELNKTFQSAVSGMKRVDVILHALQDYVHIEATVRAMAYTLSFNCHPITSVLLASKYIGIRDNVPPLKFFRTVNGYENFTAEDIIQMEKNDLNAIGYDLNTYYKLSLFATP